MPASGRRLADDRELLQRPGGRCFGLLNLFSGSALSRFSVFALGIMPYVTASIILQLMTVVIPQLEQLQKEGEAGHAKINQYTRYLTIDPRARAGDRLRRTSSTARARCPANTGRLVLIVVTLTAGTSPADVARRADHQARHRQRHLAADLRVDPLVAPQGIQAWINGGPLERLFFPIIAIGVVVSVVFVQEGQRRIPIQYAKRMVGRRQTGGGATYMPLRVNMAGVIPVIFAAALLAIPQTISSFAPSTQHLIHLHFSPPSWGYLATEFALIIVFTFFYTAVQFNPVDQADNLRKYGGFIPGIRPGPPTALYLDRVLKRLTLPGSLFLATIAVLPSIFINQFHFQQTTSRALGGTSVLIVVGVALDTMRQMESQMMMRSYEGFLR